MPSWFEIFRMFLHNIVPVMYQVPAYFKKAGNLVSTTGLKT